MALRPHSRSGFTLVELLVVVAIVGILAGLVLGAVGKAHARAQAITCSNNLRQLDLALLGFVSQFHEFPLGSNAEYPSGENQHHNLSWAGALRRQLTPNVTPGPASDWFNKGVFHCPTATRPEGLPQTVALSDYGFNWYGTGTYPECLGLGGLPVSPLDPDHMPTFRPVKDSAVVSPSEAYALGDGAWGDGATILDGSFLMGRHALMPVPTPLRNGAGRLENRHSGRLGIAFADGHVERIALSRLFRDTDDAALSAWNYDHQPHRETYLRP